ncbi:MAG TPA: HEAT repeat domain-containing protein [Pirellulales bacterium]|nr:HEAT repeat domain-containing protein [Pirellulales bacterium]
MEVLSRLRRTGWPLTAIVASAALASAAPAKTPAETNWIWSPAHAKDVVPLGDCYFRKVVNLPGDYDGTLEIACDDQYELYVNGRHYAGGDEWRVMKIHDVSEQLSSGRNVVAIKATNKTGGSAGLAVTIRLKSPSGVEQTLHSDPTWKTSLKQIKGWERIDFNDAQWVPARSYGAFGTTAPWAGQVAIDHGPIGRYLLGSEFHVESVINPDDAGSLIALAFNEWGEIVASREGGPLLLITDKDDDGLVDSVTTYCDEVKSCQGILPLNGQVFAVGDGPEGHGLYCLTDDDQNGEADDVKLLFAFKQTVVEHGAHAPVLGPDGLIYLIIGNHAAPKVDYDGSSPYHHYYEGDLVQPRYEDANGHAVGIKAPGGAVLRTNLDGSSVQIFAGGLRNPYDIAFNAEGELFTYDADMEWDVGLPWYRPTRVNHVISGGEFGWRSGWAKWPEYYVDSLGSVLDTGRGSPTGIEFYNHLQFPARYRNAMFACDWSQGRILAIHLTPDNGSYTAKSEVFLEGHPLNATDVAVGPDGWLYFCTGGRGTEGGVYRIVWTGKVPPQPKLTGVMEAIRQPQLQSAWARQKIATVQQTLGAEWERQLAAVVESRKHSVADRVRALDLMQLVGPFPTTKLLLASSRSEHAELRAKAAYLMGIHSDAATRKRLEELLTDSDPRVRRLSCESLVRGGYPPPAARLAALLADRGRSVAWAAARALQRLPVDDWSNYVIEARTPAAFVHGAHALLAIDPPDATLDAVLTRASELMRGDLTDPEFVALLRVLQLGLERGRLHRQNVPELCRQLADEYPANEPLDREQRIDRELIRLLVYLQEGSILPRALAELKRNLPIEERVHLAAYLRFVKTGWTTEQKLSLLEFFEEAQSYEGGHSFAGYLDNFARDFVADFSDEQKAQVLAQATRFPHHAVWALAALPENPGEEAIAQLMALDKRLLRLDSAEARRLGTAIVAVLARSRDAQAMQHLRQQYDERPERREDLAMGLAQSPTAENWPYLLRSLSIVEGVAAQEVLNQLYASDRLTDEPAPVRQVILCGLRLGENGGPVAVKLLNKWLGDDVSQPSDAWDVALAAWQTWYEEKYPDEPAPRLPKESATAKWSYQELLGYLTSAEGESGDVVNGSRVFEKVQCAKCHRYGGRGEGLGPDLSMVSQRFQRKEILESVLFPSQIISDQYMSKTVVTNDGITYTGLVAPSGEDAVVILQANGEKVTLANDDIAETAPSKVSAMPEGLLNTLSLQEIADLFAFLNKPTQSNVTVQPSLKRARR